MVAKKRKKKRLRNLNIFEISLTKSPASGIHFCFVKSADDEEEEIDAGEFGKLLGEMVVEYFMS